jgi:transposase
MKGDKLVMSGEERQRKALLFAVSEDQLTLKEAAKRLKVSYRQAKRIYRRYKEAGDAGLIHGRRGQVALNAYSVNYREEVLLAYRNRYEGFGPTLAVEKLRAEGFSMSAETLRQWLKAAGLWEIKRKRSRYRKRRLRREGFGELLQLDGSFHHWFGEGHRQTCLMNLVDDATGTTLSLLAEEETTEAAMRLLRKWIERYGVPKALYVDLKTVYVSPKGTQSAKFEEEGSVGFTHFSRACEKLGIVIIKAYSPQAKGRVERKHAVFQDRWVKELKLKNIDDLSKANEHLDHEFLDELNQKFAQPIIDYADAHRRVDSYGDLDQVFCWEYRRKVKNDWTISFRAKSYQIEEMKPLRVRPKYEVVVREHLDGSLSLWYGVQSLPHRETQRQACEARKKIGYDVVKMSENSRKNKHKTPWGQFNPDWLQGQKNRQAKEISAVCD